MTNMTYLTGNLTKDPELRYLGDGTATASFGLAVDRRWLDRTTGDWAEATSFFDVVTWRSLAEHVALSVTKGARVMVAGRLEQRSWTGEDGRVKTRLEVIADEVGASMRFGVVTSGDGIEDD